ncbi:histidine protein methyltransferase 1 homolog [Hylaeus anthracinus]|uniref:histidine protein methyltransferase 1 homolog n=1 Tax=Hylaeus anthracinus TaxID=313031 RepID=UPI0023BA2673|nr:histidine protein methyltransferase 1 homolog [Hylaeus anthracinus]
MFKFGFSKHEETEENDTNSKKSTINWIPASKVEVSESRVKKEYEPNDFSENVIFPGYKLKLIRSERALSKLKQENCINIIEAESQHSDLLPAKYEGGLKVWECSYDLSHYILENCIELQDKVVLDLGCGAGIIGLIALLRSSIVHFQDYNVEVIKTVTVPNVLLNFEDCRNVLKRCEFFCGDWDTFTRLNDSDHKNEVTKYDLIFTSETIYNPDNHRKLYEVFKQKLKQDGIGFIAGKTYYFGVGGGMRQFQTLIEEDGYFDVDIVWKSREGLQREILKISKKQCL